MGESRHPCQTPSCRSEPVSYAAVEEDCTSGLVIEVFDDLDKVGANVALLHGGPQSCMPCCRSCCREMLDGKHHRVDISANARTSHKGLLQICRLWMEVTRDL